MANQDDKPCLPTDRPNFSQTRRNYPESAFGQRTGESPHLSVADPVEVWARTGWWPVGYTDPVPGEPDSNMLGERYLQLRRPEDVDPAKPGFVDILKRGGATHLRESVNGVSDASRALCGRLLLTPQTVPPLDNFRASKLAAFEESIVGRQLETIVEELAQMVMPFVSTCDEDGSAPDNAEQLIEALHSEWQSSVPEIGLKPKPLYSVGFLGSAFTPAQLAAILGRDAAEAGSDVVVNARNMMICPFFSVEAVDGATGMDIADRKNAHTATVGMQDIVMLFRAARREEEINRLIIFFTMSFNDKEVYIYGHYPVIIGPRTNYHRHKIARFFFFEDGGKNRWQAYTFAKSVYQIFSPRLRKLIAGVLDDLYG